MKNWILKELTLKIDLINGEFELGYIWAVYFFIIFYPSFRRGVIDLYKLLADMFAILI